MTAYCASSSAQQPSTDNLFAPKMLDIIEPMESNDVPNYMLDTEIYSKISRNSIVEAQPASVHFAGFTTDRIHIEKLRLVNISNDVTRFHVIPPQTKYFTLKYSKPERLVPGFGIECTIEFRPDEVRYYNDSIRVHSKDKDNNIIVPIHAYPVLGPNEFPRVLKFDPTPVGGSARKVIPLRCHAPVDFEFRIEFIQSNPAIVVEPLSGIIASQATQEFQVTYKPKDFVTAQATMQLLFSQFNSKPLICHISGHSAPRLETKEVLQKHDLDGVSILDPHTITPLDRARLNKRTRKPIKDIRDVGFDKSAQIIERKGYRIPPTLNCPAEVANVLLQEPNKLKVKDMRKVLEKKEWTPNLSRQEKEVLFDEMIRSEVYAERQNQLKWQVKLGQSFLDESDARAILTDREAALQRYKNKRGDAIPEEEIGRTETALVRRRTLRRCEDVAREDAARFDTFTNDPWSARQDASARFTQATWKIILRRRADFSLSCLRQLRSAEPSSTQEDIPKESKEESEVLFTQNKPKFSDVSKEGEFRSLMTVDKVSENTFPVYKPKADSKFTKERERSVIHGEVAVPPTHIVLRRVYEYFDLTVPLQFRLRGYERCDVTQYARDYVAEGRGRALRSGATDEVINILIPSDIQVDHRPGAEPGAELGAEPGAEPGEACGERHCTDTLSLRPPPGLFHPVRYPPLYIFNPSPGLQAFQPKQPYAECDLDFKLCPLPRYVPNEMESSLPSMSAQKHFVDTKDTIRGVMTWKKFPSQGLASLANTPTLTSVWVPRWTDPNDNGFLPSEVPQLLTELPDDDAVNIMDEDDEEAEEMIVLTPDMISAEFALVSDSTVVVEEGVPEKLESFPYSSKIPSSSIPYGRNGIVPRWTREKELEFFLIRKNNRLGERVDKQYNTLDEQLNLSNK